MNDKYILDEKGEPTPCPDLMEWAKWFETAKRHVADEHIGKVRISTVFLSLDHAFGSGQPILWETMVFPGNEMDRCGGNREQAEAMHKRMVEKVKAEVIPLEDIYQAWCEGCAKAQKQQRFYERDL